MTGKGASFIAIPDLMASKSFLLAIEFHIILSAQVAFKNIINPPHRPRRPELRSRDFC